MYLSSIALLNSLQEYNLFEDIFTTPVLLTLATLILCTSIEFQLTKHILKNKLEESVQVQMILVNIFIKAPLTDVVIYLCNKTDFIAPIILIIIALSLEYVVKLFAYNKLLDISTLRDLFVFIISSAALSLLVGYGILSSGLICFLSLLIGVFAIIKFLTSISLDTVGALVDLLIEMFSDD